MQQRSFLASGSRGAQTVHRAVLKPALRCMQVCKPGPSRFAAAALPGPGHEELDRAISDLLAAAKAAEPETFDTYKRVQEAKVESEVKHLTEVAKKLGVDHVDPALNAPVGLKVLLNTDLRRIGNDSTLTLDRLALGKMQPKNTLIRNSDKQAEAATGLPNIRKGPFEEEPHAYMVSSHFRILQGELQSDGTRAPATDASPDREDDLLGVLKVIGRYTQDPGSPGRLGIQFFKMRVEPADPARQLDAWVKFLGPHNPGMDPKTGRVEFDSTKMSFPKGHLDYLAMTPKYHVSRGNLGSVVVAEPVH